MESYHSDSLLASMTPTPTPTPTSTPTATPSEDTNNTNCPSDDEYDCLRKEMLAKAIQNKGWHTELCRYLDDMPSNVTKTQMSWSGGE